MVGDVVGLVDHQMQLYRFTHETTPLQITLTSVQCNNQEHLTQRKLYILSSTFNYIRIYGVGEL